MSDFTKCAGCRNNSNGEECCPRCEDAMELRQNEDDKRGFKLPVTVSELADGGHMIGDEDGTFVARTYLRGPRSLTLAEMIVYEINDQYGHEDNEGA